MSGVNKAILVGRVGKDPEIRNLESGATVATFSLATSESWKDKATGEKKESVQWHNLVLWRALADIAAKYVHKGELLYVEGKITSRSWEKDGLTRYTTEIVVSNLVMLGNKSGTTTTSREEPENAPQGKASGIEESGMDGLPF